MISGTRKVMEREDREQLIRFADDVILVVLVLGVFAVQLVSCLIS